MRGYPKCSLIEVDYYNLLSIAEYSLQARADLIRLASIDDSKISIEKGSLESSKSELIDNPMPTWKRLMFKDKDSLLSIAQFLIKEFK